MSEKSAEMSLLMHNALNSNRWAWKCENVIVRLFRAFAVYVLLSRGCGWLQWWSQSSEMIRVLLGFAPPAQALVLWPCVHLTVAAKLGNLLELPLSSVKEPLVSFSNVHIICLSSKTRRHVSCGTEGEKWKLFRSCRCISLPLGCYLLWGWYLLLLLGWVLLSKKEFIILKSKTEKKTSLLVRIRNAVFCSENASMSYLWPIRAHVHTHRRTHTHIHPLRKSTADGLDSIRTIRLLWQTAD